MNLEELINQIPNIKALFKDKSTEDEELLSKDIFMPSSEKEISNTKEFRLWRANVLLELDKYIDLKNATKAKEILDNMKGWQDETDLDEVESLLKDIDEKDPGKFNILKNKQIYAILDGDKCFDEIECEDKSISVKLPYLTKDDIIEIYNRFNIKSVYNDGNISRWKYIEELIDLSVKQGKIIEVLSFLFSKGHFSNELSTLSNSYNIDSTYKLIIDRVLDEINSILYFSDVELIKNGEDFKIQKIIRHVKIDAPKIKEINTEYISDISKRALKDIDDENFDSAITKCRTLLEEVFCYVIEKKEETPSDKGDINKLFSQVQALYGLKTGKDVDQIKNRLVSGLITIIDSIAQMRNDYSDSHGVGNKRIKITESQARLFVNTSITVSEFILEISNDK